MIEYEYESTVKNVFDEHNCCNDPAKPEGTGWRLVSAISCADGSGTYVVWYWEREVTK